MSAHPWGEPGADPIGDVRRHWIAFIGVDNIRAVGYGPGKIWFTDDGVLLPIEAAIEKYGPSS
jgi:hypothetical protein